MLEKIETKQLLKTDLESAWDFMSDPRNLAQITPEYMQFKVLGDLDGLMHAGKIIEYHVSPIAGIKMHWVTEITHVQDKVFFVDEQRFGPYQFWHHQHHLEPTKEGVLMKDLVHYQLPLGILGKLANVLFVKKQLAQIFEYRRATLEKLFNQ